MFGYRAYPTPFLRPMGPFIIAGGLVWLGVNKLQNMGTTSPAARKDPKNPYANKPVSH